MIGTGDGATAAFQLREELWRGPARLCRGRSPSRCAGTVRVAVDGVARRDEGTASARCGDRRRDLPAGPRSGAGAAVTAGFEFDVPVRFDTDYLAVDLVGLRGRRRSRTSRWSRSRHEGDCPPELQAHLDGGATTLCRCWQLTRRDGARAGLHRPRRDSLRRRDLRCRQRASPAREMRAALGLAVDNLEVAGALALRRAERSAILRAGRYDDAAIEIWLVDWSDAGAAVLLRKGSLGEVRARAARRSPPSCAGWRIALNQPGAALPDGCDAELGDARCGVDLDDPAYRGEGTVAAVSGRSPLRGDGPRRFRRRLVRARPADLDERRQCRRARSR